MGLRAHGSPIDVADLSSADTLMVFVHGLGATELQWSLEYLDLGPHVRALQQRSTHCRQRRGPHRLLEDVVVATGAQRLVLVGTPWAAWSPAAPSPRRRTPRGCRS